MDLSFNCIKRISGLGSLTSLTDLTLSNNQIATVEGLSHLKELVFLSLHNNRIARLGDMIKHLLTLPKLQVLNCNGNDFTKDKENYVEYLVHYMRGLKYVNSQYVEKMKPTGSSDKYKLDELEEKQTDFKKKDESVVVNENDFIDAQMPQLIRYDEKLLEGEGVREVEMITKNEEHFEFERTTLKESVRTLCNSSLELIKIHLSDINKDVEEFNRALKSVEEKCRDRVLSLIQAYYKKKKHVKLAWEDQKGNWRKQIEDLINWMHSDLNRDLMWVESDFLSSTGKTVRSFYGRTAAYSTLTIAR